MVLPAPKGKPILRNTSMSREHNLVLRTAVLDFCRSRTWTNPHAVTLTLRQVALVGGHSRQLTPLDAQQNLRHFLNVLRKQLLKHGLSKNASLWCLPIFEGGDNQTRPHYHLMLDNPASIDTRTPIIQHEWRRTLWGHQRVTVDTCVQPW
jgi:hypothetical protein